MTKPRDIGHSARPRVETLLAAGLGEAAPGCICNEGAGSQEPIETWFGACHSALPAEKITNSWH